jgi:hypothetical protein
LLWLCLVVLLPGLAHAIDTVQPPSSTATVCRGLQLLPFDLGVTFAGFAYGAWNLAF